MQNLRRRIRETATQLPTSSRLAFPADNEVGYEPQSDKLSIT
jgi:hypothetical protein